jgi:hypothetical protein
VQNRKTDLSWLGAEALPGDLAEINRVYAARHTGAGRYQGTAKPPPRGFVAAARRWLKGISPK